jgi:hypothetical protein
MSIAVLKPHRLPFGASARDAPSPDRDAPVEALVVIHRTSVLTLEQ